MAAAATVVSASEPASAATVAPALAAAAEPVPKSGPVSAAGPTVEPASAVEPAAASAAPGSAAGATAAAVSAEVWAEGSVLVSCTAASTALFRKPSRREGTAFPTETAGTCCSPTQRKSSHRPPSLRMPPPFACPASRASRTKDPRRHPPEALVRNPRQPPRRIRPPPPAAQTSFLIRLGARQKRGRRWPLLRPVRKLHDTPSQRHCVAVLATQ